MNRNILAYKTLAYIWSHPNCQHQRLQSIGKFFLWQFYKRLTHRFIDIQLTANCKIRCHPDSASASAVLYCGLYDYDEMNFLLRYLQPEDVFIDVGANIGVYTLLAASRINSGSIFSFEPLLKNYKRLQENIKINKLDCVKAYPFAISDQVGDICLDLADGDSTLFITDRNNDKSLTVPTNTLDNLLSTQDCNNLVLAKMDIEGAELLALKGATMLLSNQRPFAWILEINESIQNFDYQAENVVSFLQDFGYELYQYDARINKIYPITLQQKQGNNVLAIASSALTFVRDRLETDVNSSIV